MINQSTIPLPAVAANSGPFKISDSKNSSNYCVYPNKKTKGVLSVPLDDRPDHLAIRLHEYGHLQLISSGFHAWDLPQIAYAKGVNGSWFQSSLDVIVNAFLTRQGCEEIINLPLLIPNEEWPVAVIAEAFLRSAGLQVESKIKSRVSKILPKEDIEFLRNTAIKLNDYSLRARLPIREFFLLIRKLIERFGKKWDHNNSDDWGTLEDIDLLGEADDDELPSKDIETLLNITPESELNDLLNDKTKFKSVVKKYSDKLDLFCNKWGEMEIANFPLVEAHPTRKNARKIHPGFVGAFRYPHRALLPASDGMAFAHRKKAKGGTVLLDCSGSMGLSPRSIINLLNYAPMLTVAAYAGNDDYYLNKGSLAILIKNGMIASRTNIKNWSEFVGDGNIVDGPAIRWLIKQAQPRIWISDGQVTGINDQRSDNLDLEIMLLKKIGRIKQFQTITDCLRALKTKFIEENE